MFYIKFEILNTNAPLKVCLLKHSQSKVNRYQFEPKVKGLTMIHLECETVTKITFYFVCKE